MIDIMHYTYLSAIVLAIGSVGLIYNRENIIALLMCVELILLAVSTQFLTFAYQWQHIDGQVFVLFILAVAAAESAIGLALFIVMFRQKRSVDVNVLGSLKG